MKTLLAWLVLCSALAAQVTTKTMTPGVVLLPYEVSGDSASILWDARQPIDLAYETIETGGEATIIIGRDGTLTRLDSGKPYSICKFEGEAGETVIVSVFDFSIVDGKPSISKKTWQVEFDGEPEPDPDPTPPDPEPDPEPDPTPPDVPDDEFGNLAQRVAKWAEGLPSNKAAAAVYRNNAKALRESKTLTIGMMKAKLNSELTEANAIAQYSEPWQRLNAELQGLIDADPQFLAGTGGKLNLARFYELIAVGLEAAK